LEKVKLELGKYYTWKELDVTTHVRIIDIDYDYNKFRVEVINDLSGVYFDWWEIEEWEDVQECTAEEFNERKLTYRIEL
jgi:hypothetical protein